MILDFEGQVTRKRRLLFKVHSIFKLERLRSQK
jgi:hypothetical protein